MMKRKFLAVVLPIIGCATVVGSGFAAWYFNDDVINGDNGSTSIGINVTEEVKASKGSLKIDLGDTTIDGVEKTPGEGKNGRLVLDQGGARNNSVDSGIMFGDDTSTATTATGEDTANGDKVWAFTVSYNGSVGGTIEDPTTLEDPLTIGEIYDAGLRIRINFSITINGDLDKYITFQDNPVPAVEVIIPSGSIGTNTSVSLTGEKDSNSRSGDYTITYEQAKDSVLSEASWEFKLGVNTIKDGDNYKNALLKYRTRGYSDSGDKYYPGKPVASGEPESMEKDLTDDAENPSNIVFAVKAFIEDDTDR